MVQSTQQEDRVPVKADITGDVAKHSPIFRPISLYINIRRMHRNARCVLSFYIFYSYKGDYAMGKQLIRLTNQGRTYYIEEFASQEDAAIFMLTYQNRFSSQRERLLWLSRRPRGKLLETIEALEKVG
jgi:hypothetical protein